MEDNELLQALETDFAEMKKKLKLKASFEDLDKIFFIQDLIQKEGYVTSSLSRLISHRIVNTYMSWNNYLHGIVMPNPNYMISLEESQIFDEEGKKEIIDLMTQVMALTSRNAVIGITKDEVEEGKFMDDSVTFWNNTFSKGLLEILQKVNTNWTDKTKE